MKKAEQDAAVQHAATTAALALKKLNDAYSCEVRGAKYAQEAALSDTNLKCMQIQSTREIYKALPLREVKMVSMGGMGGGGGAGNSLQGLLPALHESWNAVSGSP